jgi:hypothetical protein
LLHGEEGEDAVTKFPNVTLRIKIIEASIEKLQAELEDAEGERKDTLEKLIEEGRRTLERLKRHVLH